MSRPPRPAPPPIKCDDCDQVFQYQSFLVVHRKYKHERRVHQVHNNSTTVACTICKRAFESLAGLNSHMKKHVIERSHSCKTCNKKFTTPYNLKHHMKKLHSAKDDAQGGSVAARPSKIVCKECGAYFKHDKYLQFHMALHRGEKPTLPCPVCNSKFQSRSSYNRHLKNMHPGTVHRKGPPPSPNADNEEQNCQTIPIPPPPPLIPADLITRSSWKPSRALQLTKDMYPHVCEYMTRAGLLESRRMRTTRSSAPPQHVTCFLREHKFPGV